MHSQKGFPFEAELSRAGDDFNATCFREQAVIRPRAAKKAAAAAGLFQITLFTDPGRDTSFPFQARGLRVLAGFVRRMPPCPCGGHMGCHNR